MKKKDLLHQFGITRSLLLNYEKYGIINPRRKDNGFRDFSINDIFNMLEIKHQSDLGITLRQLQELYQFQNVQNIEERYCNLLMTAKRDHQQQIQKSLLLNQEIDSDIATTRTIKHNLGLYWYEQRSAISYKPFANIINNTDLSVFENNHGLWPQVSAFCSTSIIGFFDRNTNRIGNFKWCFTMSESVVKALDLSSENVISPSCVLVTSARCKQKRENIIAIIEKIIRESAYADVLTGSNCLVEARLCLHTIEDNTDCYYFMVYFHTSD